MNKIKMFALTALAFLAFSTMAHADVTVTVQQIDNDGMSLSYNSTNIYSTNTYIASNDGRLFLHFKKTGAGAATVTIATPQTVQGIAIADRTVTVAATTGDVMVGPFSPTLFNDANGNISFTVSDSAGFSQAAIRL